MAEKFTDRISWIAARLILVHISNDEGFNGLSPETRGRVERFLRTHPAPPMGAAGVHADEASS